MRFRRRHVQTKPNNLMRLQLYDIRRDCQRTATHIACALIWCVFHVPRNVRRGTRDPTSAHKPPPDIARFVHRRQQIIRTRPKFAEHARISDQQQAKKGIAPPKEAAISCLLDSDRRIWETEYVAGDGDGYLFIGFLWMYIWIGVWKCVARMRLQGMGLEDRLAS